MDMQSFVPASSGDLLADRRFEIARQFAARGDFEAAADLIRQALDIASTWPSGWFLLGEALVKAGRKTEAAAAFRQTLSLDPEDRHGAILELALLGEEAVPGRMPDAYVQSLFDQYAGRFDDALVGGLNYRAPWLMRDLIDRLRPGGTDSIIDLGCGTGLAGEAFRDRASAIDGIDLSPGMIAQALKKQIYRTLETAEIRAWLQFPRTPYTLALAADVLIYLGALDDVLAGVKNILAPNGLFCFTVQSQIENAHFMLGPDHRYSYSQRYLEECAQDTGYVLERIEPCVLRKDEGRDVAGFLCLLTTP